MDFVAIDVETANGFMGSVCQIGAVKFVDGVEVDCIDWLVDPEDEFWEINSSIHGISEETVLGCPTFEDLLPVLIDFVGESVVVSHTHFDRVSIQQACLNGDLDPVDWQWLDSARVARRAWRDVAVSGYGLASLAERFGIDFCHHNACEDARTAGEILIRAINETSIPLADWPSALARRSKAEPIRLAGGEEGPLAGETICFTGQLSMIRRDAAERANQLGAAIEDGVTKRTTMLVVGDQDLDRLNGHSKSSKHRKAEKMIAEGRSIRIVAERDFTMF